MQPKMVNKNHFQFDRKSFFNFWKIIYSFKNRKLFSEFKSFILAGIFVGIHRLPEFGQCQNLALFHQNLATSSHHRRILAIRFCLNLVEIWSDYDCIVPNSDQFDSDLAQWPFKHLR